MKRIHLTTIILALTVLVGCTSSSLESDSSSSSSATSSEPEVVTSPLVVSKLLTASSQRNNVIELYNPSAEAIALDDFHLDFYSNGSLEVTASIALAGTVGAHAFFAIGSSNNDAGTALAPLDFTYDAGSLPFNGNDVIDLVKDTTTIDRLGTIGLDFDYSFKRTLIRLGNKDEYVPSAEYDPFGFITYIADLYGAIKSDDHEIKTLEDIYAGPALEDRYKSMPFVDPSNSDIGGGGAVQVINSWVADGDTASFQASGQFGGGSVRYYYVNTPEVQSNYVNAEPWGYVASKYNKEYILAQAYNKTIYVQSMKGGSLTELNGRYLALVWVNGALSQFLTVSEGLSEDVSPSFSALDQEHTYKNVPILTFLQFAEHRAKENGWGTKGYPIKLDGEKSPDWNYTANGGLGANSTTTPVWWPHLPLPWAA